MNVTTVGLSPSAHDKLKRLKEDGFFGDLIDGYRFAIALAIANGSEGRKAESKTTIFNVGSLDPDGSISFAVSTLLVSGDDHPYRTAEALAEWGVEEMWQLHEAGDLSISRLLKDALALENA